jgi:hypothetical protein
MKKNELNLDKGSLFGRKGFIMKEVNELYFTKEEVDFAQIHVEGKRWCKPQKDGALLILEEKKFWISADALILSGAQVQKNIEEFEKAIEYAKVDKDKGKEEEISKSLKTLKKLSSQTKKLYKYAQELAQIEALEKQKNNENGEIKNDK